MGGNSIGQLLSEEQRRELAVSNLKPGAIVKFHCLVACKEKRFVVVGEKYDKISLALVHINSEINERVFNTPKLKDEHYKIHKADYQTLDWDSHVNCSQLITRPKEEIFRLLINNPACHLEHLSTEHFKEVQAKLCKSRVLTREKKKEYGLFYNC